MEIPFDHVEDNLIFSKYGQVWAYFKIEGFSYDLLDNNQKLEPFARQFNFLNNLGLDIHYLTVPHPTDIKKILNRTIRDMEIKNYNLKEGGIEYFQKVMNVLIEHNEKYETSEYYDYIGIQLDPNKNKYVSSNFLLESITKLKGSLEGLDQLTYSIKELNPGTDILERTIESYKMQSETIHASLNSAFGSGNSKVIKAQTHELLSIFEKNVSVRNNNADVKPRFNFESGERFTVEDSEGVTHHVLRKTPEKYTELLNTMVDEFYNNKFLHLSKVNQMSEVEELYTQYFAISQLENVNTHPGFEWLHGLKLRLGFPVMVSVRADTMPNEMIKKRLSNVKLEIKDQMTEAYKGGEHADALVDEAGSGVVQMEKYFQSSGFPSFSCNYTIKITGESKTQLKERADALKNVLTRYGIKIVAPYGEQVKLMNEVVPGGKKYMEDYKQEVEAGILAGMMFGSSTNIGDNRGFYIGHTSSFNKPVFILPELAAKAYEGLGNTVNSISALVAGATGFGKSFFMNLFVYLSALTGSKGLIIDPKGDRKGWDNGLPYIPREEIEVWTLGADKRDAGSLDPFRTSSNKGEGAELTLDILSFLTDTSVSDLAYGILNDAVNEVIEEEENNERNGNSYDPCIGSVIKNLKDKYENKPERMTDTIYNSLEGVVTTLTALEGQTLSSLLFGQKGQNYKTLDYSKAIQVLMIQNLNLASQNKKTLIPSEKISEAIMISITAWTKSYMYNNDRSIHKFILQDEASAVERNETGAILMDHIVRQGRYWNTTLLKGSQNATDHGSNVANMGMKFSFKLSEEKEAREMLKIFNLPLTHENIEQIIGLDTGECMFQDIYGRTAKVKINPIFTELFDAFDSSTSTKEEREQEKELANI